MKRSLSPPQRGAGATALLLALLAACAGPGAAAGTPAPPAPAVGPTPTLRVVMQASDPAAFAPAAGQPQLVEFFAYW